MIKNITRFVFFYAVVALLTVLFPAICASTETTTNTIKIIEESAILKYGLKAIPLLLFVRQGIIIESLRGKPPTPVLDPKIREFIE